MGYYSLRDPIHNNDVINNGHDIAALAAFKKHLRELLFFFFKSSVQLQALATHLEKRTVLKKIVGKTERIKGGEREKEKCITLCFCYQTALMSQFAK